MDECSLLVVLLRGEEEDDDGEVEACGNKWVGGYCGFDEGAEAIGAK